MPTSSRYPKVLNLTITETLHQELKQASKMLALPVSTITRDLIDEYLPRYVDAQRKKRQSRFSADQ